MKNETPQPEHNSGNLVNSPEELVDAFANKPKGFNLQIKVLWEKRQNIWQQVEKVEAATGQKIAVSILKMYSDNGKPTCLIKLTVVKEG